MKGEKNMKTPKSIMVLLVLCFCLIVIADSFAEVPQYELQNSDTVKLVLERHTGKEVIVRLNSGGEVQGVVTKVGDNIVHISKISTMSYYDAVVRIDGITAVLMKVRAK
jgi:small nuclear ribonucleoprotein (snRNP)-like protein